jgi:hypothetical protein
MYHVVNSRSKLQRCPEVRLQRGNGIEATEKLEAAMAKSSVSEGKHRE